MRLIRSMRCARARAPKAARDTHALLVGGSFANGGVYVYCAARTRLSPERPPKSAGAAGVTWDFVSGTEALG